MISCCWCVLSFRLAGSLKLGRVPVTGVKQRATLSRLGVETASNSFHLGV
jgi:hypothetical protein